MYSSDKTFLYATSSGVKFFEGVRFSIAFIKLFISQVPSLRPSQDNEFAACAPITLVRLESGTPLLFEAPSDTLDSASATLFCLPG